MKIFQSINQVKSVSIFFIFILDLLLKNIFLVPTLFYWQYCSCSCRSDAQPLDTSMPIAWIPGRYGNCVAPTQICILSSLWSPWSPILMGAEVLLEFQFQRGGMIKEREESGGWGRQRRTQSDKHVRVVPAAFKLAANINNDWLTDCCRFSSWALLISQWDQHADRWMIRNYESNTLILMKY